MKFYFFSFVAHESRAANMRSLSSSGADILTKHSINSLLEQRQDFLSRRNDTTDELISPLNGKCFSISFIFNTVLILHTLYLRNERVCWYSRFQSLTTWHKLSLNILLYTHTYIYYGILLLKIKNIKKNYVQHWKAIRKISYIISISKQYAVLRQFHKNSFSSRVISEPIDCKNNGWLVT